MAFRRVLRSEELPLGEGRGRGDGQRVRDQALRATVSRPAFRSIEIGGEEVLLTRLASGEVVAFEAYCPHQGVSLTTASVFDGYVRCPQHYYLYDPRTGRNILPTDEASPAALCRLQPGALTTYPVREQDGWIVVGAEPNPPPPAPPRHAPDPAPASQPACPPPRAEEGPVEHPPEELCASVGAEVALKLVTRLRPGHLWHVEVGGTAVCVQGQAFQDSCTRVGLTALEVGHATVRCSYGLPWSGEAREVRTFTVRVTP